MKPPVIRTSNSMYGTGGDSDAWIERRMINKVRRKIAHLLDLRDERGRIDLTQVRLDKRMINTLGGASQQTEYLGLSTSDWFRIMFGGGTYESFREFWLSTMIYEMWSDGGPRPSWFDYKYYKARRIRTVDEIMKGIVYAVPGDPEPDRPKKPDPSKYKWGKFDAKYLMAKIVYDAEMSKYHTVRERMGVRSKGKKKPTQREIAFEKYNLMKAGKLTSIDEL
jgi:hypothetical protein